MIETVLAFMMGWIFIPTLILGAILIIYFHESDDLVGWSHIVFILLGLLIANKYGYNINYVKDNPWVILQYVGMYIGVGVIWAFCKWYFYLKNISSKYIEIKAEVQKNWDNMSEKEQQSTTFNELLKKRINNKSDYTKGLYIDESYNNKYIVVVPQASKNKQLITTWISHWPISMLWTLINDPIKKAINWIFESISHLFQGMSDRIFKGVKADFSIKEKE